ncbi:hypothetical protein ROZALSC1DRAFT_31604 [Rozella allomycis CSF55]|uniref:Uncharacterized protein n=1 Tax=Rozella allomycis (strain CSF55) TaxID=988480 RepID=A0A4P9YBL4_ROZAC|nr:hypothetical protein ROZALSC1DRAFT_31604 [Rozella allomycis CSF55]
MITIKLKVHSFTLFIIIYTTFKMILRILLILSIQLVPLIHLLLIHLLLNYLLLILLLILLVV